MSSCKAKGEESQRGENKEVHGKEAAGSVFGPDEFTDLLLVLLGGETQMFLVPLSSADSLFPVTAPGVEGHLPVERFKDNLQVIVSLDMFYG